MHLEVQTWISHMEAMNNEGERLAKIASHEIRDKEFRDSILDDLNQNINLLNDFNTYRNVMNNIRECDELECDQFDMVRHDQVFENSMAFVTQYCSIRDKVYQKLLV